MKRWIDSSPPHSFTMVSRIRSDFFKNPNVAPWFCIFRITLLFELSIFFNRECLFRKNNPHKLQFKSLFLSNRMPAKNIPLPSTAHQQKTRQTHAQTITIYHTLTSFFSSSISPFSIWPPATIRISQSTPKIPIQGPSIKISAFPFPRIRWSPHTKVRIHVMSYRGKIRRKKSWHRSVGRSLIETPYNILSRPEPHAPLDKIFSRPLMMALLVSRNMQKNPHQGRGTFPFPQFILQLFSSWHILF